MTRRTPLVEQVIQKLERRIRALDGDDAMLPAERELASDVGVSRPVIREAIRNLQERGLVEVRHGVGVRAVNKPHRPLVGAFDRLADAAPARIAAFADARLVIEPGVARLAAARAKAHDVRRLRENIERHAKAARLEEAVELDLGFHRQVALAADNPILVTILDALADLGRETRTLAMKAFGMHRAVEGALELHARIADAIERHDADEAENLMRRHLLDARRDAAGATRRLPRRPASTHTPQRKRP